MLASAVGGFAAALVPTLALEGSMWVAALGAGAGAAVSGLKGALARLVGDPESASLSQRV
ncbi:hypothetical protein [Streptomyces sp. AD55]|uniref:hypothetical protein n=1 Tax=Streptomyces sp. AD55 TaxID=3242895 RepID=UPI003528A013